MPNLFLPHLRLRALFIVSRIAACSPPDKPPTQQPVEESWKRIDDAIQQSHVAEQKRDEAERLREVDRVRVGAEQAELTQQRQLLAGWARWRMNLCRSRLRASAVTWYRSNAPNAASEVLWIAAP